MSNLSLFLLSAVAALPYSLRIVLGRILGVLVALLPTREKKIAVLQLKKFLPSAAVRPSVYSVYAHLGQTILESINLTNTQANVEIPEQQLKQLLASGKGIVALSAHLGNWEQLAARMIQYGFRVTLAAREARSKVTQTLLAQIRAQYGAKVIWRIDGGATRTLIRDLKSGAVVAALIDQDTEVSSVAAPFFGLPVKTPSALISLAQRTESLLVSAFIVRTGLFRSKIFVEPLPIDLPVEQILAEYHRRLERLIIQYPAQWVWIHKRWRSSLEGRPLSSREYIEYLRT